MQSFPYDNVVYEGNPTEVSLLDNILKTEGIDTIVAPPKTGSRSRRAVYILDDAQLDRAREIVRRYVSGEPLADPKTIRSWRCRTCNELIEGQFAVCWKCGRADASRT
jgi:hypothetical protein